MVLGAAKDTFFHPRRVDATVRAYGTQAVIFPGMAHDMMLEAGWQAAAERILSWLSETRLDELLESQCVTAASTIPQPATEM